jgi:hypothetical protein
MKGTNDTPPTPWQRAQAGKRGRKSEEEGAKLEGGRRVSQSGAGREKGDIRTHGYRIQDKTTDKETFSITRKEIDKLVYEALMTPPGLLPQLRVTMPGYKLRVMREEDYLYMQARADAYSDGT